MQVPEHLRNYIDYEAYGRDIALEESGQFTDLGYVRDTGDSFHEYYDGERGSIPEEYRVMTFQDDIPEEEISNGPWTLPTIWTSFSGRTIRSMPPSTGGTRGEGRNSKT